VWPGKSVEGGQGHLESRQEKILAWLGLQRSALASSSEAAAEAEGLRLHQFKQHNLAYSSATSHKEE